MELRSGGLAVVAAALVWTLAVAPGVGAAGAVEAGTNGTAAGANATDCAAVCVDRVDLSSDRLAVGERGSIEATVTNAGASPANVTVALEVTGPNGTHDSYELDRSRLAAGETTTVAQSLDATTPGTHRMRVVVYGTTVLERHDASSTRTLVITERGLGGALDRSEYALGALVGSVAVIGGIGYRRR